MEHGVTGAEAVLSPKAKKAVFIKWKCFQDGLSSRKVYLCRLEPGRWDIGSHYIKTEKLHGLIC